MIARIMSFANMLCTSVMPLWVKPLRLGFRTRHRRLSFQSRMRIFLVLTIISYHAHHAHKWILLMQRSIGGAIPPKVDPYENKPQGPVSLADRWQSRCLKGDTACGEGYGQGSEFRQTTDLGSCDVTFCEHQKYALSPADNVDRVGY